MKHFVTTIKLEPNYQKAYYNLAMVCHIVGRDEQALTVANQAVKLNPYARSSLVLKATILQALGRMKEAGLVMDDAEFLPGGNWSENIPAQ